jgi:hypothetical protein
LVSRSWHWYLIYEMKNAQQGAAPDGNSAALHCRR